MDSPRVFGAIYAGDRWTGGSGPGSRPDFCRPLVRWLARYIRDNRIRSIVDLGCGDFQWMPQVIAATGARYCGLDVYAPLVTRHRAAWPSHSFEVFDVSREDPAALPAADLYWAKDVLQHWPDGTIERFLDRFFGARPTARLVVCNCSGQAAAIRVLDDRWHFAPLDGARPPLLAFGPERLFRWGGKDVHRLSPRR